MKLVFLLLLGLSQLGTSTRGKNLDPSDTLTKPLIVDPNAPTDAEAAELTRITTILASEPSSASVSPPDPNQDDLAVMLAGGESSSSQGASRSSSDSSEGGASSTDTSSSDSSSSDSSSSDSSSSSSSSSKSQTANLKKEMDLLQTLIDHGEAIADALPAKKQRLAALKAQLNAALGQAAVDGANQQLKAQQALLVQITAKIQELKAKLEDLETTQTRLQTSINNLQNSVSSNEQVAHQLNQEAAKASVESPSTGAGTGAAPGTGGGAASPVAAASRFVEDEEDS